MGERGGGGVERPIQKKNFPGGRIANSVGGASPKKKSPDLRSSDVGISSFV